MIRNKKGFSLIELMLVMGIAASMVIAAFIVYPKVLINNILEITYKDIHYTNDQDFSNFQNIEKNISENTILKVSKTNISPSNLPNSGLVISLSNVPELLCSKAFSKPEKFKIYYVNINNHQINKESDLKAVCQSIQNKEKINIEQYIY